MVGYIMALKLITPAALNLPASWLHSELVRRQVAVIPYIWLIIMCCLLWSTNTEMDYVYTKYHNLLDEISGLFSQEVAWLEDIKAM